ncbi:Hypothetical predicted protein [Paramuricea clavata]|uniref:Uncharacterized protein n=1 Tax=Paramuricea clavata TaxID=317549 RepID=A0A7D9LGJ0_PARCT|nr:Hypothetical predicted protein [Paramuricea clavata]
MASRVLDPLGPLYHLWQSAISAEAEGTAMIGNAFHCALVDRRKSLLTKVSPDCLDLVDDPELFTPGNSDLFGKRFKKAIFKDLKLTTNHLSLFIKNKPFKPFHLQQPGKGHRVTIPALGTIAGTKRASIAGGSLNAEENPTFFKSKENSTNRYCSKYKTINRKTNGSEIGSSSSIFNFQSFKSQFSVSCLPCFGYEIDVA